MDSYQTDHEILHGVSLSTILDYLIEKYGFEGLHERIAINCFASNPSKKSSLKFLRNTQWAHKKVEDLYIYSKREEL